MAYTGPMTSTQIPYGRQQITEDDEKAVLEALRSDFLTQGPRIGEFEEAFAKYVGARYAVAVSNGTAALHLAALALGVNSQTRVITTPITFAASANCVAYCGGKVDFVDIDPETALIDVGLVRKLLESQPRGTYQGLIPVDFAGAAVNIESLRALAIEHDLWIIEDACHAPGGYFLDSRGQRRLCGDSEFADIGIFSFHPVKHIACGEGGMITTNNPDLYQKLLLLRTHGITKEPSLLSENHGGWYYEMQELGYNYRLTDLQAALGLSQLRRADAGLARRREIAAMYDELFRDSVVRPLGLTAREGHAFHLYVVKVPRRKELYEYLKEQGIFAQVHYIPLPALPYYRNIGHSPDSFPVAQEYYAECLSLPMYPALTDHEVQFVADRVLGFLASGNNG